MAPEALQTPEALHEIMEICERAYAEWDRTAYAHIQRKLEGVESCPEIDDIRGLCTVGFTLLSPRFAYPHIAGAARRMRERLRAAETTAGAAP